MAVAGFGAGRCRVHVGGPASGRLQHTGIILSYALFPPALLLLSLALQRRSMLIAAAFGGGRGLGAGPQS